MKFCGKVGAVPVTWQASEHNTVCRYDEYWNIVPPGSVCRIDSIAGRKMASGIACVRLAYDVAVAADGVVVEQGMTGSLVSDTAFRRLQALQVAPFI